MHNVNLEAVRETAGKAAEDPGAATQPVAFDGEWQTAEGAVQFTTEIPLPDGRSITFEADYPPQMGGTGAAPGPARSSVSAAAGWPTCSWPQGSGGGPGPPASSAGVRRTTTWPS